MRRVIHTPISGFPEFLPQEQILFNRLKDLIRQKFELYGGILGLTFLLDDKKHKKGGKYDKR